MRVLLVEDNDGDADLVREALSGAVDADVHLARVDRLEAATARLDSEHFDVVLLDLSLPDAIGLDGLHRLRAVAPSAPIVVLTGSSDRSVGTRAIQNGAQDYLQKGQVEGSEVLRAIRYARERTQYAERARLLSDVGVAVGSSLDTTEMLLAVEATLSHGFAEWCAIDGATEAGEEHWGEVVPTPASHLYVSLAKVPPDDPHRAAVDDLQARGFASALVVHFRVDEWPNGAITCARRSKSAPYGPADLALAEEITRRVSAALERSGLLSVARRERERAEVALRSRDEFLATLSHELRTPLNAILGWTQLLRAGQVSAEKHARALETIERNAKSQVALIEDVLDVSRIITGKLRLHVVVVDVLETMRAALESVRPAAEAKGVSVEIDAASAAAMLKTDPDRLLQVFWNLLSNAVKFTPQNGQVIASVQADAGFIEVRVTDTGKGIEASFLPHVFERFRQADSTISRAHGGLGLGLAITRHLVEAQGGTIRVDSAGATMGTTFVVRMPSSADLSDAVPAARPALVEDLTRTPVAHAARLAGISVLVVDDDLDTQWLLQTLLEACGASVVTASSVVEAFGCLSASPPDVLVSDIGMPGLTGYDLIRRVRALGPRAGGATAAVALTAYARPEDRTTALESGFDHHLTKPVNRDELVAVMESLGRRLRAR